MKDINREITYALKGGTSGMKKGVLMVLTTMPEFTESSGWISSPCAIVEDATGQIQTLDLRHYSIKFTNVDIKLM